RLDRGSRGGRRRRHRAGARDPRGPSPAPGAEPGRPVSESLAVLATSVARGVARHPNAVAAGLRAPAPAIVVSNEDAPAARRVALAKRPVGLLRDPFHGGACE